MKLTWQIDDEDVNKVLAFYRRWANDPFVTNRKSRNLDSPRPPVSKESIWMALVGCLLTTQQRSGPGSAVKRILDVVPFPLRYATCRSSPDLEGFAQDVLTSFGGIRRAPTIAQQMAGNLTKLEEGFWLPFLQSVEQLNTADSPSLEREVAHMLALNLAGIGPKQSRNLLQWLGVTKHEIPVDSRITKWLNRYLLQEHLSADLLVNASYYDMVSDGLQALCRRANLYPCLLDAAIFASFDGGWSESDISASESLANA